MCSGLKVIDILAFFEMLKKTAARCAGLTVDKQTVYQLFRAVSGNVVRGSINGIEEFDR